MSVCLRPHYSITTSDCKNQTVEGGLQSVSTHVCWKAVEILKASLFCCWIPVTLLDTERARETKGEEREVDDGTQREPWAKEDAARKEWKLEGLRRSCRRERNKRAGLLITWDASQTNIKQRCLWGAWQKAFVVEVGIFSLFSVSQHLWPSFSWSPRLQWCH